MYQTSIRNKKQKKILNNSVKNDYEIDINYEEYAIVTKLLGSGHVLLTTNSGNDCIGVIRGALKKFSKRILIEKGDIVAVSIRDYQKNKVDIVHKYNREQIQQLINNNNLSQIIINFYNNKISYEKSETTNENSDDKLEFDYNLSITDSDDNKSSSDIDDIDDI
jgi:initiation factor 1A